MSDANMRAPYLQALLGKPEVARVPFPERTEGVTLGELYVAQKVEEERRIKNNEESPGAPADLEHALQASVMQEVIKQVEVDLWQTLQEQHWVVAEAPAWTGKSTLCRWVTHACQQHTTWLPIFVNFRDFAQSRKSMQRYLTEEYTAWLALAHHHIEVELPSGEQQQLSLGRWLYDQWQAGQALLILDGADEEFVHERRKKALGLLPATRQRIDQPRVLLTSRPLSELGALGFHKVTLKAFDDAQIDALVRRCGQLLGEQPKAEQFLTELHESPKGHTRDLASRPGHLVQLFTTYVRDNVLLHFEDDLMQRVAERRFAVTGRLTPPLTPDDPVHKRQVMEAVSFHLLFCRQGQSQTREQMLNLIGAVVAQAQENGAAVYSPKDTVTVLEDLCRNSSFLKQSRTKTYDCESVPWLQFFAACHLARQADRSDSDPQWCNWLYTSGEFICHLCRKQLPPFHHYFWHEGWRTTIILFAGLVDDTTPLLKRIQAEPDDVFRQMLTLATQCLCSARKAEQDVAGEIFTTVCQQWRKAKGKFRSFGIVAWEALSRRRQEQWTERICTYLDTALRNPQMEVRWSSRSGGLCRREVERDWEMEVRLYAAEALAVIGGPQAVSTLLAALHNPDCEVRQPAAKALGAIRDPQAVPALLPTLRDRNARVRQAAARALGKIGNLQAASALLAALRRGRDLMVRAYVEEALRAIRDPQAVPALLPALRSRTARVREAAVEALGAIRDPQVVPALLPALRDPDEHVRRSVAKALGAIRDPQVVPALLPALRDPDEHVRRSVAKALGAIRDPQTVPALVAALQDPDWIMRLYAAGALRDIGDPQAVPALLPALQDRNAHVRQPAVKALGAIGAPQAVPALLAVLQDPDKYVRQAAVEALGVIKDPRAVPALLAVLQDPDWQMRQAAVKALGAIGDPQVVPALKAALQDPDRNVRTVAARALGDIGDPRGVPSLGATLLDVHEHELLVRVTAAEALGKIGSPQAVFALMTELQAPDGNLHQAAAEALGAIRDPRAVPVLLLLLRVWDRDVRTTAVEALGKIGDSRAVPALEKAVLQDPDERVYYAAIEALGAIGHPEATHILLNLADEGGDEDSWKRLQTLRERAQIRIYEDGRWKPLPAVTSSALTVLKPKQSKVQNGESSTRGIL
jgi:HEAT repeat protein